MVINDILTAKYFDNTILEYLTFLGILCLGVIAVKIIYWIIQKFVKVFTKKSKTKLDDIIVDMVEEPAIIYMMAIVANVSWQFLEFPNFPKIDIYFGHVIYMVVTFTSAWLISRLLNAIIDHYLKPLTAKSKTDLDDHLLPIVSKMISVISFAIALIMVLQHFGQEIGPMIAGLGIGGLAFALAAKDLLSNLFGSVTILFDKPFSIGERIKINDFDGSVQEINLRTTRIQTLEGRNVYVPNSMFTDSIVENVSQEWARKVSMTIGLVYDTNAEGMKKAKEIIKKSIMKQEDIDKEQVHIAFTSFGDFSKNILVIYWITKPGFANIIKVQDEINMDIMVGLEKASIDMAFPTQTIELKK